MKTVSISDFKARCLQLIEEVQRTGHGLLITKRGKPAARVLPPDPGEGRKFVPGMFRDQIEIIGDIVSPLDIEWDVLK